MLNVTWENNDFSFNSDGYLVNPPMIIITLDRERQWDKVSSSQVSALTRTRAHAHARVCSLQSRTVTEQFHTLAASLSRRAKEVEKGSSPAVCRIHHTPADTHLCSASSTAPLH